MFVCTIPDELFTFINRQFLRFQAPFPSERALNEVGEFVMGFVANKNYFPRDVDEAAWRYNTPERGLTEPEKFALISPIEYRIKVQLLESISFDQLHLAVWSALMWCWSDKGVSYVRYHQETFKKDAAVYANHQVSGH